MLDFRKKVCIHKFRSRGNGSANIRICWFKNCLGVVTDTSVCNRHKGSSMILNFGVITLVIQKTKRKHELFVIWKRTLIDHLVLSILNQWCLIFVLSETFSAGAKSLCIPISLSFSKKAKCGECLELVIRALYIKQQDIF